MRSRRSAPRPTCSPRISRVGACSGFIDSCITARSLCSRLGPPRTPAPLRREQKPLSQLTDSLVVAVLLQLGPKVMDPLDTGGIVDLAQETERLDALASGFVDVALICKIGRATVW